jgi:hypothetical protein
MNNDGQVVAETGKSFISVDSPGITVWPIPSGTKYINNGSMTVDTCGRVHVLVRGEDGSPAHFQRDPATAKWTRKPCVRRGKLLPAPNGQTLIVSDEGVQRMSADRFRVIEQIAHIHPELFEDSKIVVDSQRLSEDGWLSVIGQRGKRVTVVDVSVGKISEGR